MVSGYFFMEIQVPELYHVKYFFFSDKSDEMMSFIGLHILVHVVHSLTNLKAKIKYDHVSSLLRNNSERQI